jgi:hypothetical protein
MPTKIMLKKKKKSVHATTRIKEHAVQIPAPELHHRILHSLFPDFPTRIRKGKIWRKREGCWMKRREW